MSFLWKGSIQVIDVRKSFLSECAESSITRTPCEVEVKMRGHSNSAYLTFATNGSWSPIFSLVFLNFNMTTVVEYLLTMQIVVIHSFLPFKF